MKTAKYFLDHVKVGQRWFYKADIHLKVLIKEVTSKFIKFKIEDVKKLVKGYSFSNDEYLIWDTPDILREIEDINGKYWELLDDVPQGSKCCVCGLLNEYIEDKDYICYNCRN